MILDVLYKGSTKSTEKTKVEKSASEGVKRSLLKTISWRVIGTLDTVLISYLITGGIEKALAIGGVELITKMILYFFHERAWNKINIGR